MSPSAQLLSLVFLAMVVTVAVYPTRCPSASAERRDRDRRARYLRKRPSFASAVDVRRLLIASAPAETVEHATVLARERRIPTALLWQWADRHGAGLLVLTLAAGLDHADLLATLEDASNLDVESLEILSDLYRNPVSLIGLARATTTAPSTKRDGSPLRSRSTIFGASLPRKRRATFPSRTS